MDITARLCACLVFIQCCYAAEVHIYVGGNGTDRHNNGSSIQHPVQTIARAIRLATASSNHGKDIFIELLTGYHELTSSMHVQHSGTSLTIRSYQSKPVIVSGGQRIPVTSFQKVTDATVLNALPAAARQHVRYAHLPDVKITYYPPITGYGSGGRRIAPLEVFYNEMPFHLARWPNEGYINIAGVPDGRHGHRITYNSTRPASWKMLSDIWVYGHWYSNWNERAYHVENLDTKNMIVRFNNKTNMRSGFKIGHLYSSQPTDGGYFRFFNILSELDQPGEYYLDRKTGNLYVWLPTLDGSPKTNDVITVSHVQTCFAINKNTHYVNFSNFIIEACREKAVYGHHVNNLQFTNMEIRNTGDFGLYFDSDSRQIVVTKSRFRGTDGGVRIIGGSRKALESSGTIIEDNTMYSYAREGVIGKPAISIDGVGAVVRHNEIYRGQTYAIQFFGNDHVMEYNHIHHVCLNISNCGAIMSAQDWTFRGNKIRFNSIHDIKQIYPGLDNKAVYLDNMFSSAEVSHNVFYNNQVHVMIGGGRDNKVEYNIMYNSGKYSIQVDGRGATASRNTKKTMHSRLFNMPFNETLWKARYPNLANILSHNDTLPIGNKIRKNLIYNVPHRRIIYGLNGWVDNPIYFDFSQNGYSYGNQDHFDTRAGDYRVRCHAGSWANRVNFQQVVTPNDVGPRYDVGPTFHKISHRTIKLTGSANSCPALPPAKTSPMSAYLPDGSGQKPVFNVFDEGCWLHVVKCTNDQQANGTYRDMYGERQHGAAEDEAECMKRAGETWRFCGSKPDEEVIAIYGPTGATTYGGTGCYRAVYGCPRHGGPADGHVVAGSITHDGGGEARVTGVTPEEVCLAHALSYWHYCGSHPNHPVTNIYRPTGKTRTAGAGCWISMEKCPKHPTKKSTFYDAEGATNAYSDDYEPVCLSRAEYFWTNCGSDRNYPVTATYRPTTHSSTFP